jgi:soluble lytic murein transglycosylase-like protein
MLRRVSLAVLLVVLVGLVPAPPRSPAARAQLCRGSTTAHVPITWPTTTDLLVGQAWGHHVPARIARWAYLFLPLSKQDGLDPYLVAGVMRIESNGEPLVKNLDSDARGLMQVLHASYQPGANIRLGLQMLAAFQREFHRRDLTLAAYNAGPGAVQAYGGVPPYPETQAYVVMVSYWRDTYAGVHVTPARTAQYHRAEANVRAFIKRVCGH